MANEDDNKDLIELNIARRTRSHLQIDDFEFNEFFFDADRDLYQNPESEGDTEYKQFLNQCYSAELGTDTNTEDNDPDYVHNQDIYCPGWEYDLDEAIALHQNEANFQSKASTSSSLERQLHIQSGLSVEPFSRPEFARILNQQLRQHIQLLTQTFLLTRFTTDLRDKSEEAKSYLNSYLKAFKNRPKPSNLLPALELVNNVAIPKDVKSSIRLGWRHIPMHDTIRKMIRDNKQIFIYPSLRPKVAFSIRPKVVEDMREDRKREDGEDIKVKKSKKAPKINFTLHEDKLLAFALEEFKGQMKPLYLIATLLMTAKTRTQISDHIKNIKRSGNEDNPIKLYYTKNELPQIDFDSDACTNYDEDINSSDSENEREVEEPVNEAHTSFIQEVVPVEKVETPHESAAQVESADFSSEIDRREENIISASEMPPIFQDHDHLMNMDLDDLMAASTTISKSSINNNVNNSENNKSVKNLKLKKSMLSHMSHNFSLPEEIGDLMIYQFLKTAQIKLSDRNYLHLLQLLTDLMRHDPKDNPDEHVVTVYREIVKFLRKVEAPQELSERVVLLLDHQQAIKCGCAMNHLHWMRFFEFMQHVELYHEGDDGIEKKLARLIDALQKEDSHKIKLAVGNLINKHPFLKRAFDSLSLDGKPHPSLFLCAEDFDDITQPMSMINDAEDKQSLYNFEHFNSKTTKEELSYASQSCPCKCHAETIANGQPSQHCGRCNLKFMKGRMYLVNKIKPILAEWSYTGKSEAATRTALASAEWTLEEDREILEFCQARAAQNEETVSFDTSTFEKLINRSQASGDSTAASAASFTAPKVSKRTAKEIAERFNQLLELMESYKDHNS